MSRKRKQKFDREALFSADIIALSHEGRGIAELDGKKTFIDYALPGETVSFSYHNKRSNFDEGIAKSIEKSSPHRAQPPCEFFTTCGGCSLQHLQPAQQLAHKQQVLLDHFQQFAGITPKQLETPLSAKTLWYRRKARLGVRYVRKKEKILIGFRESHGRYLADMNRCEILVPAIGHHIQDLTDLVASLSIFDAIAQIEIAVTEQQTACVFRHLQAFTDEDISKLIAFGKAHDIIIYLQPKGPDSVSKLYPNDGNLLLSYTLKNENLHFQFHPLDFIQVNAEMNEKMIALAMEWLQPQTDETILDLFCGLGNFSLPLAKRCNNVTAMEGDIKMVERAKQNAKLNGIDNITFSCANLFETEHQALQQQYDKILLDPPRAGAKEIMPLLANSVKKSILYISCNSATLARDSKILLDHGFSLSKAAVMDMFPHTTHAEAIALFHKDN